MKFIYFILLVACAKSGYSQLQCYVCNNCAVVNSETPFMTCEDNVTTEDPFTTTMEYTEVSSTTQSVSTDSTTSDNTQTTIENPGTTQSITTSNETYDTTTEINTPTTGSESTIFDTTQTTIENPGTTQSITTSNETYDTTTEINTPTTGSESTIFDTTTDVNTPTQSVTTDSTPNAVSVLARIKRNLPSNRFNKKSAVQFKCFSLQHAGDNNRRVTKRGCVKFQENVATTCDNAVGKGNGFDQCVLCGKDRCNFGNTLTVSIITLTTSILILLFTL